MSRFDCNEVNVFEDTVSEAEIIKSFIDSEYDASEEPFCLLDIADVIQKHRTWMAKMPRVLPHYAVKCNSDPTFIKILSAMNVNFDCASEHEIRTVIKQGVPADRIIFANPAKFKNHIKFARKINVDKMTVDNEMEILKINDIFPEAKIVIRIRCDSIDAQVSLGTKFGCNVEDEAVRLIHLIKSLGLTLWGFSFHVGSPCGELNAYKRGITACKGLIAIAREIGCKDVQLIDIGGGFPGDKGSNLDRVASIINDAIQDIDPNVTIISEPGQYYATSAFTLASMVHTKRLVSIGEKMVRMYHMNAGVYNCFIEELLNLKARHPLPLNKPMSNEKFLSCVWGPTCDSLDCILKDVLLPEFEPRDWLIWRNMGAYTISLSSSFNGFMTPTVHAFIRKSQWKEFSNYIGAIQNPGEPVLWSNGDANGLKQVNTN